MLRKKSRELTWKILAKLSVKDITTGFDEINPCILKCLEKVYVQARFDADQNVKYSQFEDGPVHFPDE